MAALLLAMPGAGADDVVNDPVCTDPFGCYGAPVCLQGIFCQLDRCDPAASCRSDLDHRRACATNATIQGQTCQEELSLSASFGRPGGVTPAVPTTTLGARATLTQGNVSAQNLTNAWISHSVQADAVVLGDDLGTTRVSAYRSVIDLGEGHDPVRTLLFPEANQTFSQVGLEIRQSALGAYVVVGVFLLDQTPEGCFVATSQSALGYARCPAFPVSP